MISKNPPKVFIRLLSCSFYNSWQKLKRDGEISTSDDGHGNAMIEKIPSSHYTLNTIKKSSKEHFKSNSWTFSSITQRVQLSLEIYPTEMFVSIVIFLPPPDPKHENFRWDHGFQPSPSEAWNRDNLRINKMAAEIIHPTAPPHIYPPLLKGDDFRLNICDYQKELESDISHYKQVAKKYRRVKFIAHATSVSSGVTSTLFSLRGSLSGTGMVIRVPLATSNIFFAFRSTGASVYGQRLERKISKHEKTISIPEVKLLSISKPSQKLWMTIKSQILNETRDCKRLSNIMFWKRSSEKHTLPGAKRELMSKLWRKRSRKNMKKTWLSADDKRKKLMLEFDKRSNGFSLSISR